MSSYVLFTLDKLVAKVVKQIQLVLQEEQSHRLVELWRYEDARGTAVSAALALAFGACTQAPGRARRAGGACLPACLGGACVPQRRRRGHPAWAQHRLRPAPRPAHNPCAPRPRFPYR